MTHGAGGDASPTLTDWLGSEARLGDAAPIHRLDKPVSGLILFTADPELRAKVGEIFAQRETRKLYRALVHGRARRKGVLRRPLKDARRGSSVEAVTRYKLLEWVGPHSLLDVRPETGRKHQIRRHLHGIGHAVVGDQRYRKGKSSAPLPGGGIWLHAFRLELPDGRAWEAPVSPILEEYIATLRCRYSEDG
jgi:23S rRNA-/tRNA-specific pseudouridylate synthase